MRIKQIKAREDALSDDEIEQLKDICRDTKDRYVVYTPVYAGLRVGELAHLNRSWLDWTEKTINIPPEQGCWCWDCRHYRKGVWQPKTQAGIRSVFIQPMLEPILRECFGGYRAPRQVSRQALEQRLARVVKRTNIRHLLNYLDFL